MGLGSPGDQVLGDFAVKCPSGLQQDRVVCGLLDQGVAERIRPAGDSAPLHQQIPAHQVGEGGVDVDGAPRDPAELGEAELPAQHGRQLEHQTWGLVDAVEAGGEEPGDPTRYVDR